MKRLPTIAVLVAVAAGAALWTGGLWRVDTANIVDDAVTADKMTAGVAHAEIVVAASGAPAKVLATADYVCDGTADDVQIQAAIDALPACGGEVRLSEGTFHIAATIDVIDYLHLRGAGHYATVLYAAEGLNSSVLDHDVATATGGFRLSNLQINGRKWKAYYGASLFTSYLAAAHRITGAGAGNTEAATGRLYLSIVKVDATPTWRIDFYSDSGRTTLVAHTDDFIAAGLVAVNADAASGLGGHIGVRTAVEDATYWKARTDVSLQGNYAGDGFSATNKMIDAYFDNFVVQSCAERGMDLGSGWGNIIQTGWVEWTGSDGIRATGGGNIKISNMKVITVDGHAIALDACGGSEIINCELNGGDYSLVDAADAVALWSTGKAGLYLADASAVRVCNTYFVIPASCYGISAGAAAMTNRTQVTSCSFTKGHATLNTSNVGILIPARDHANGSGVNWVITGNVFSSIATGFQVSVAGGRETTNTNHVLTGNLFQLCTTGAVLGSRANAVTGGLVSACTTGMELVEQRNMLRGVSFVGGTTQVSVAATGDYANIEGCAFNTGTTCILLGSGAYNNVLRNNEFISGVSVSMSGATALVENNVGAGAIVTGSGSVVSGKCTAVESGNTIVHKTKLTFTLTGANDLDLADTDPSWAGIKVYDFPAGDILILGAVLNADAAFGGGALGTPVMGVGTAVEATDATLDGTQANVVPSQTLAATVHQRLASALSIDGTGTPVDLYVNVAAATVGTGAATVAVTGTLTLTWTNLGDF